MFKENDHLFVICPITMDENGEQMTPEKVLEKTIMPKYNTISVYKILNTFDHKTKYDQALAETVSIFHDNGFMIEMLKKEEYLVKIYKDENDEKFLVFHIRVVQVMETIPTLNV